jgi:magnesium-transporting ATPase (P-type)
VAGHLGVQPEQGLSETAAAERLARHGPNRLPETPPVPAWRRFLRQLGQPLVVVLILSGTVTLLLGEGVDAGVIFAVVLVNAAIGYWQEGKAEGALAALARTLATPVTVRRAGHRRQMAADGLVPGDMVILAAGDRVPADLRIVAQRELRTDESSLTGESLPVDKHSQPLPVATLLADRANMAYAGTTVLAGQGSGIVVATGRATETGRIAGLMAATEQLATPLTRRMATFSGWLLWAIGGLALLTFAVGIRRGESAFEMFMAAVALAVGAIPEGLPAAVSVTLAIGVARMARRRAIIRRLAAVETLGSTTVICSDKTGTLTENAMTVRFVWCAGVEWRFGGHGYTPEGAVEQGGAPAAVGQALRECLLAGALCNDASLRRSERHWEITGDPTEAALLVAARKGGLDEHTLRALFPRRDELPFDASRQFMATRHDAEGQAVVYVKGAPERLLPRCTGQLDENGQTVPLHRPSIEAAAHAFAAQGMRVLLLARATPTSAAPLGDELPADLVLLGLVAMIDPPRPAAIRAVHACQAAGIRVKMITGDHAATATAIARLLGIGDGAVLTGSDLAGLDDQALRQAVATTDVFARVEPEQKLRLVRALQARGEVVAMTGDGVNDAPALKQADIGIAMGQGGTEVAKEAAAMVLTDDNFVTIEAAVEEGRGVWDNLVKFITWTLPTNFGEGLVIVAAVLAGVTLPITPLQILWINMSTAVLLGLPLAFEPIERGIMARPPRQPDTPVLDGALVLRMVLVSVLLLAGAFGLFMLAVERGQPLAEARTIAVNVFVMVQVFYLFNCRSLDYGFWRQGWFSNRWLWAGVGIMLFLQFLLTYVPLLNAVFQTAPLSLPAWLEIIAVAAVCSVVVAAEKWSRRQYRSM